MYLYKGYIIYTESLGNFRTFNFNFSYPTKLEKNKIARHVESAYGVDLGNVSEDNVFIESEENIPFLR
jgi:hypothetical protein